MPDRQRDAVPPGTAESRLEAAIAAHREGRVAEAEEIYREVLAAAPDNAEARHMLGVVHLQRGRLKQAQREVKRALAIDAAPAKYHNTLGSIFFERGLHDLALASLEAALARDPGFGTAAYNRGRIFLVFGRAREAEAAFQAALRGGARDAGLFNDLASALMKQGRFPEVAEACREGLTHHPGDAGLRTTLASALELSNELAEAEAEARRVREAAPDYPLARLILARVLRRRGAPDEALAVLTPIFRAGLTPSHAAEAHFELGLIHDARGAPSEAFRCFAESNALQRRSPAAARYDGETFLREIGGYRRWLDRRTPPAPAAAQVISDEAEPAPVFFVGFPRSGTTLMEQMLRAHPRIVTTAEVTPLAPVRAEARRLAAERGQTFPDCLEAWDAADFDDLRRRFRDRAEALVGPLEGRTLVDKLPVNIVRLGLVEKLWPGARVLVALRDPRDACLSCFMQRFTLNSAMVNFLDLERTGRTYAETMGLWLRSREVLSLASLEYRYEDLVADFEGTLREVLDFIGVGWHPAVTGYREAAMKEVIRTPSYRDVTAPIHQHAVGRWKAYEAELAPILPVLAPFVESFGYEA